VLNYTATESKRKWRSEEWNDKKSIEIYYWLCLINTTVSAYLIYYLKGKIEIKKLYFQENISIKYWQWDPMYLYFSYSFASATNFQLPFLSYESDTMGVRCDI